MNVKAISRQEIIMNYAASPSSDDILGIALIVLQQMPRELTEICDELGVQVEEFPDTAIEQEMELETPYDLLALFRSGNEISPGVQKKVANGEDALILYRRPILDLWCETGDDLAALVREVVVEEIARANDFSETDIQALIKNL